MTSWRKTINIKDLLTDDDSDEYARFVARTIAGRLQAQIDDLMDIPLELLIDDFYDCGDVDSGATRDDVNELLSRLYDWADYNRIWLGT